MELTGLEIGAMSVGAILLFIYFGMHVAVALALSSFLGLWALKGDVVLPMRLLVISAGDSISSYAFGLVPLFVLMGFFVNLAELGRDAYAVANSAFRKIAETAAAWNAAEFDADRRWIFELDERARCDLVAALTRVIGRVKSHFDYSRDDFDLGSAEPVLRAAFTEMQRGRGVALVRGLPRAGLDEKDFELLTWGIGLHFGVGRPQGGQSHYISAVRDAGNSYRTGTGRGYNTNAELDFHTDSADIVVLSCYNRAAAGGMSITTSSVAAYHAMRREHPDLADLLHQPIHFSRHDR